MFALGVSDTRSVSLIQLLMANRNDYRFEEVRCNRIEKCRRQDA